MDQKDRFILIAITSPGFMENEACKIARLFEAGIDFVHIRKPEASIRDIRNLIEDIPYRYRQRLKLHGHFDLINDFNLGGVHLNSRCPVAPANAVSVSKSCHSLEELKDTDKFEYVTLSPIFDSISKTGYRSKFNLDSLKENIAGKNVIALGGVSPSNLCILKENNFRGAAMLGAVWDDFDGFIKLLKECYNT